jgi:excisionase family DNA binding protein
LPPEVASPWLTITDACKYARIGRKVLYRAIEDGRCRAAHVDGRRKLLLKAEWIDSWLESTARIVELPHRGVSA